MGLTRKRLVVLTAVIAAMLAAVTGRLVQLQLLDGTEFTSQAAQAGLPGEVLPTTRGLILDLAGSPLVGNTSDLTVFVAPGPSQEKAVRSLAQEIGEDAEQLAQRLLPCGAPNALPRPKCFAGRVTDAIPVPVANREAVVAAVLASPAKFPGVKVARLTQRSYPQPAGMSQLLGYLGPATAEEAEAAQQLAYGDEVLVGRTGLEEQYDTQLRGRPGIQEVSRDSSGEFLGSEVLEPAEPGQHLLTSISAPVQARAERALAKQLQKAKANGAKQPKGAAAVLDVQTGRVLAISSAPQIKPGQWQTGLTDEEFAQAAEEGALPNHATTGVFPPGSTVKPFTILAMLANGNSLEGGYNCPASYWAGDRKFRNYADEAYGTISLARALEVSCNTVFYAAADKLWRTGGGERSSESETDEIAAQFSAAGLGTATDIDLGQDAAGSISSPAAKHQLWQERRDSWCAGAADGYPELAQTDPEKAKEFRQLDRDNCDNGHVWRRGDAINAAIGQGLTGTTPLQMAIAYAALASGNVWSPKVGRALLGPEHELVESIDPLVRGKLAVSESVRNYLLTGMSGVTKRGTAAGAFAGFPLDRIPVAGKTGSAQVTGERSTSWFAALAPANEPRYAVVVTVSEGGTGGSSAAVAARSILETMYGVGTKRALPKSGPKYEVPTVRPVQTKSDSPKDGGANE